MKLIRTLFAIGYSVVAVAFAASATALVVFALIVLWEGISSPGPEGSWGRFNLILEGIGLLTIALAAFELGQTILEQEVLRETHVSTPTRVRRFLSRFMIVIIIALSIEALVAVFRYIHDNPAQLPRAAMVAFAAAALLVAWGIFVQLNTTAERLEPEAMEETKREDDELA